MLKVRKDSRSEWEKNRKSASGSKERVMRNRGITWLGSWADGNGGTRRERWARLEERERERGRSLITETFSTLFLSVSPSVHPSQALALCQGSRTDISGKNKHEGLYVTETHSWTQIKTNTLKTVFLKEKKKEKEAEMMHDGEGLEYR